MNWSDFLFNYAITTLLQVIKSAIKNPAAQKKYFPALRKVALAILAVFPEILDDPSVRALTSKKRK